VAALRLTTLVVDDRITQRLREHVWRVFPPDTPVGYLVNCTRCASVWAAGVALVSDAAFGGFRAKKARKSAFLLEVLAVSETAILLNSVEKWLERAVSGGMID